MERDTYFPLYLQKGFGKCFIPCYQRQNRYIYPTRLSLQRRMSVLYAPIRLFGCLVYIMWCWPFENVGCHNENSEVMIFVMMALVFELERALGRS